MVDHERVKALVRELLEAIGEDPTREGLLETPRRVADMYVELFEGIEVDPGEHLRVTFEAGHDEMVMVRGHSLRVALRTPPRSLRGTGARGVPPRPRRSHHGPVQIGAPG